MVTKCVALIFAALTVMSTSECSSRPACEADPACEVTSEETP